MDDAAEICEVAAQYAAAAGVQFLGMTVESLGVRFEFRTPQGHPLWLRYPITDTQIRDRADWQGWLRDEFGWALLGIPAGKAESTAGTWRDRPGLL